MALAMIFLNSLRVMVSLSLMLCGYVVYKAFFFKFVLRGFMNPHHDENLPITPDFSSIADFHCQTTRRRKETLS